MIKVGYDAQAFLWPNGGTGKGMQLRNLLGPYISRFLGFASNQHNASGMPLIQQGFSGYTLWQQFSLPGLLKRHGVELFLAPYNVAPFYIPSKIDLILVLHDLILMQGFRKPDRKGRMMDAYRRWQIGPSVRRARVVLTVSEYSRGEILKRFPRAHVRVLPCTIASAWFAPRPIEGRAGYLLMTTSSAPHKNADGGLAAYARYAAAAGSAARPLRIVGMSKQAGQYQDFLTQASIVDQVSFLPFLSESELIAQYQDAAALFFPSFAEGFGIPMLEAMATGTPIVAANTASLPEVGGGAARYVDPYSIDDMAAALGEVLGSKALRKEMAGRGLIEVERYAPDLVGAQVKTFWQEIAGLGEDKPQSLLSPVALAPTVSS